MKSFTSAALFAAAVLAQNPETSIVNRCQNSVDRDLNNTPATVRPIAEGLFQINITTGGLDDQVLAFDGSQASVDSLLAASSALLADIANATTTTSAVEPLTTDNENDALFLVQYVADVVCTANKTVDDLIAIKGAIVDACEGPTTLDQLQRQLDATIPLINITANKIPDDQGLSGFARTLAQPILDSLQQGIDAFADQTALPASCISTSTTQVTSTPTSTSTSTDTATSTDAGAGVTTTTAVAGSTYGSGGNGGSYTTVTEDCEESSTYGPTKSASYSSAPTGGNGGGAYHSGAPYPTGSYSSSGPYQSGFTTSCTEGAYYGSSSASKSSSSSAYGGYPSSSPSKGGNGGYGGAVPSSSAYGGNGGYSGAVPSSSAYGGNGGYPSSSAAKSSYAPSSSASKGGYGGAVPTGGYSSGGKSNSTGGYGSSPYTGAAASTAANVFGLLVAAIGAVALL